MKHAAAVCLVALCTVQSARAEVPAAQAAADAVLVTVNLARTGKLTVLIPVVEADSTLVQAAISALPNLAGDACGNSATAQSQTAGGFIIHFPANDTNPNYADLIDSALDDGLAALASYPSDMWGAGIWLSSADANNIGYLLSQNSTKAGCAITKCSEGNQLVLCRFSPGPVDGQAVFSKDYYTGIKARTVPLSDMTAADINYGSSSGGGNVVVPSVLVGGLLAMLTMASA